MTKNQGIIRLRRSTQIDRVVVLGLSLIIGLNVFVLGGWVQSQFQTELATPYIYLLFILFSLPITLTYVETAVASTQTTISGLFNLAETDGSSTTTFGVSWFALLGYVGLIALLGWGVGLCIGVLLEHLFNIVISVRWLAFGAILTVGIGSQLNESAKGLPPALWGYIGILIILIVAMSVWQQPQQSTPSEWAWKTVSPWAVVALLVPGLWSIILVLDHRGSVPRPLKTLLPILITLSVVGGLIGTLITALSGYPLVAANNTHNLDASTQLLVHLKSEFWEIFWAVAGLWLLSTSINSTLFSYSRLIYVMTNRHWVSQRLVRFRLNEQRSFIAIGLVLIAASLLVVTTTTEVVAGIASLGFLWTTATLQITNLFQFQKRILRKNLFVLPFYPLFPGLAAVICILLSASLPTSVLQMGLIWAVLGVTHYIIFRYRHNASMNEPHTTFQEKHTSPLSDDSTYNVMVVNSTSYGAESLILTGAKLAQAKNGRLVVLHVLTLSEHLPTKLKRFHAQSQLDTIRELIENTLARANSVGIDSLGIDSLGITAEDNSITQSKKITIPIVPFVRVAQNPATAIVDTIRDAKIDLLLVDWKDEGRRTKRSNIWESKRRSSTPPSPLKQDAPEPTIFAPPLEALIRTAPCDLLIMRGQLPDTAERVLIECGGENEGSEIARLVELGNAFIATRAKKSQVIHISNDMDQISSMPQTVTETQESNDKIDDKQNDPLSQIYTSLDDLNERKKRVGRVEQRAVQADTLKTKILQEADDYDLLLLNTPLAGALSEDIFATLPVEVAQTRTKPTLLVRLYKGRFWLWWRDWWHNLYAFFPSLTIEERSAISMSMRQAAEPSINFFILITLASTIATLGLLQNSIAVIIGAMLVAPLMSPIASLAMGIVEADIRLIRIAGEASCKGIAVAMMLGVAITRFTPEPVALGQILARTEPTLLDLAVALASGAAGSYALSRKEVSAALPGVSIAVALVPPLCVVGYGIASSHFEIAGGAILLFVTNFVAIVLAACIMFILLGFRPPLGKERHLQRGMLISMLSLVLIAIPLAMLLGVSLERAQLESKQSALERDINTILHMEEVFLNDASVSAIHLDTKEDGTTSVHIVILSYSNFNSGILVGMEERLNAELEHDITLEATVLSATKINREQILPGLESQ